jgi:hypothetical protein
MKSQEEGGGRDSPKLCATAGEKCCPFRADTMVDKVKKYNVES